MTSPDPASEGGHAAAAAWRKICCGVDFSETSRLALFEAARCARLFGAELTLVHVYERPAGVSRELATARASGAEVTLLGWRRQAEFLADRPVEFELLEGDPAATLVRFAREGRFDHLVVGTCGRRGMRQHVLGSVAEHVVRTAHCAVLAVRRREHAEGVARR
jgi:nucleotide-binding universal stress UspA family protein